MDALTGILPILTSGAQVASAGSNIYQGYENQKYQDYLRNLAQNPQAFNAYANQFVQPLSGGLQKSVANEAQGYAAERGLGESPALTSEIVAQAIAPYVQQNQQFGYNEALQALGLGGGAKPTNTSQGLTQLFAGLNGLTKLNPSSAGNPAAFDPNAQLNAAQEFAGLATPPTTIPASTDYTIPSNPGLNDFAFGAS